MGPMENLTFVVSTIIPCNVSDEDMLIKAENMIDRHAIIGCRVLLLLQEMLGFQLDYEIVEVDSYDRIIQQGNRSIDIYAVPAVLSAYNTLAAFPIGSLFEFRLGFLGRQPDFGIFRSFYSEPFSASVWACIILLLITITFVLYTSKVWENKMYGTNELPCLAYELLVAFSALCQHYLQENPKIGSRRVAYFVFFLFAYITYCFFTSNLCSHLISDRKHELSLDDLADSDYTCTVMDSLQFGIAKYTARLSSVYTTVFPSDAKKLGEKKFNPFVFMNISTGIRGVKTQNVAFLSDFITLYPLISREFKLEEICQLFEVDLYRHLKKYFLTSIHFPYKEEFKIRLLNALERGVLRRLLLRELPNTPVCSTKIQISTQLVHIAVPLAILASCYVLAVFLLVLERIWFMHTKYYPYTE